LETERKFRGIEFGRTIFSIVVLDDVPFRKYSNDLLALNVRGIMQYTPHINIRLRDPQLLIIKHYIIITKNNGVPRNIPAQTAPTLNPLSLTTSHPKLSPQFTKITKAI